MHGFDVKEMEMTYRYLLTTSELLDALKLQRESTATDKWGKFLYGLRRLVFALLWLVQGSSI